MDKAQTQTQTSDSQREIIIALDELHQQLDIVSDLFDTLSNRLDKVCTSEVQPIEEQDKTVANCEVSEIISDAINKIARLSSSIKTKTNLMLI